MFKSPAGVVEAKPSRFKLTVWTPVLPQASGIAHYNSELILPALARLADVSVIVDDDVARVANAGGPYAVVPKEQSEDLDRNAMPIYHMGNHVGFHRHIHDALLENPGVLVLHDPSLYDFYFGYHDQGPGFEEELRYNYGESFAGWARVRNAAGYAPDRLAVRLERRIVEASRAVFVHSAWARDELIERFPTTPVFQVPLAAPRYETSDEAPDFRARYGWTDEHVVFGLPAAFAAHKRASYTARLFGAVHAARPEARLLVTGRLDRPDERRRFQRTIEQTGVGDAVQILADADPTEFDGCLAACDAMLDLRWPSAGETPATLLRAFAAGKPAIVSDLPQLREFDGRFCWRIPVDPLVGARTAVRRMIEVARDRVATREAGWASREYVENAGASPEGVASRYVEIVRTLAGSDQRSSSVVTTDGASVFRRPVGVSVLGDFEATTGLMEVGRRTISALVGAGAELDRTEFKTHAGRRQTRRYHDLAQLQHGRSHQIDLWLLNINEFWLVSDDELKPDGASRYTIGSWFWELPSVPEPFAVQVSRVDEVWVGSRFVRDSISRAVSARTPITIVPCLVDVPPPPRVTRSEFGLPDDATILFFNFDARSTEARKNPWGTIRAFEQAFDHRERSGPVRLVMKVDNLDYASSVREPLRAALDGVNGVLIEADLTREAMNGLLSLIDIYVSLHRAEGFGLGIAEAMFLGKPAVVTAYSGNLDFTNATNSCLVGYRLRPIEESDHELFPEAASVYQPGLRWAEPSIEQAARWMRLLYDNADRRREIGRTGAATIRTRYNRHAVQRVLVRRLDAIDRALRNRSRSAS